MKIIEGYKSAKSLLSRQTPQESPDGDDRERVVRQIVNDVRDRGDAALFEYTEKFDGV
ncbi:MAG: histidinol dehydrogenase, partial [Dehalococcoidales bacterium]|nr:histidinol dehydrogenase [Dehalococcoidales bacterium]